MAEKSPKIEENISLRRVREDLSEEILDGLGYQAAQIIGALDRWFEITHGTLNAINAKLIDPKAERTSVARSKSSDGELKFDGVEAEEESTVPQDDSATKSHPSLPVFELGKRPVGTPYFTVTESSVLKISESWEGWRFHQSVQMLDGGIVLLKQDRSTPGVVSPVITLPAGGLLRVRVSSSSAPDPSLKLNIRLVDESDRRLGPELEIVGSDAESFWFVPARTKAVKVYIIALAPTMGAQFQLDELGVELLAPEAYFEWVRAGALAPTIASLASIPARREMLRDCVNSLLLQCDVVRVFLNGYPDVPEFLRHPRIEVRRSQEWDDKGDAGKFGWIEAADRPGYRVIVDDDLIFPPDFVEKITESVNSYENRAIVAMHGVLLKQPVTNYYDPASRSVFHFESPLRQDRTCHVLGTNALCYYSQNVVMKWADYQFRNMADIFLARYAQEREIPMVALARPQYWVRQNTIEGGFETIYESSLKKNRSKFDSSMVQDALVKWIEPITLQPTRRSKVVFVLLATDAQAIAEALASFEKTRWLDYDWSLMVVPLSDNQLLTSSLAQTKTAHEIHVVNPVNSTAGDRLNAAISLTARVGFDVLTVATDHIRFKSGAWMRQLVSAIAANPRRVIFSGPAETDGFAQPISNPVKSAMFAAAGPLAASLATDSEHESSGKADEYIYAWFKRLASFGEHVDEKDSRLSGIVADGMSFASPNRSWKAGEPARPRMVVPAWKASITRSLPPLSVNEFFERAFVINLDRRPDRFKAVSERLRKTGIEAERVSAVDGRSPDVLAEFEKYNSSALVTDLSEVRPIKSNKQFYQDYDSEMARVAFVEGSEKRKAIRSAGAWAYLKTWEGILERVLRERLRSAVVFDDDVVFHRDAPGLFAAAAMEVPSDWKILQLGTLQYEWGKDWTTWCGRVLYRTDGSAIGSHAVGFHFDIAPFLLEHVKRMLLPFDTGALSMATRAFRDQCFVIYPNVAIQALDDTSDINTSDFQKAFDRQRVANVYRWFLPDYPG